MAAKDVVTPKEDAFDILIADIEELTVLEEPQGIKSSPESIPSLANASESSPASIDSQPVSSTTGAVGGNAPRMGMLEFEKQPSTMSEPWMQEELKKFNCRPGEVPVEVEALQHIINRMREEFQKTQPEKVRNYIQMRKEAEAPGKGERGVHAEEDNPSRRPEHSEETSPFSFASYADDLLIAATEEGSQVMTSDEIKLVSAVFFTTPKLDSEVSQFQRDFQADELLHQVP